MPKVLKIRDLTLRGSQHSLFHARLKQKDINPLLPLYRKAGFYIVEVWGADVAESMIRYLGESPWDRLRKCNEALEGTSILSALTQGVKLFGNTEYPNYVLEALYKEAFRNGLQMMRIYDKTNNLDSLKEPVALIKDLGGMADVALAYYPPVTIPDAESTKKKGIFSILFGENEEDAIETPAPHSDGYYVELAKEVETLGATVLTLKDIDGLASPSRIYSLMPKLKQAVRIPVDFHTQCLHGNGLASTLMAIIKGVDIVDTGIWWFAEGSAPPALELVWIFCQKLNIEIEADMEAVAELRKMLKEARKKLSEFDSYKECWPADFESLYDNMPPEIDALFDKAIQAASDNCEEDLIKACCGIEDYFGFPHAVLDSGLIQEVESQDGDSLEKLKMDEEDRLLSKLIPDVAENYLHSASLENKEEEEGK